MRPATSTTPVGQVFTPVRWARWAVETCGFVEAWLEGATIMDPTAGEGAFLEALIESAAAGGRAPDSLPVHRLLAIEQDAGSLRALRGRLRSRFGLELPPANIMRRDVLEVTHMPVADILVGNPPWANFCDLPDALKQTLKSAFVRCGLVSSPRALLLGGARIDLAALVIAHSIRQLLRPEGRACFFIPLSLYLNDGAHEGFRRHEVDGVPYALRRLHDLRGEVVFEGVTTRYGLVELQRDASTSWPVPYHTRHSGAWTKGWAAPVDGRLGPLSVATSKRELKSLLAPPPPASTMTCERPRQGVNACGASDVFLFDEHAREDDATVVVSNRVSGAVRLPARYVHPLVTPGVLRGAGWAPERWILIPHDTASGRPLTPLEILAEPLLAAYLRRHEARLRARKGTMLQGHVSRGLFWALLGVGPYSFTPYKVLWEAYGKSHFSPTVIDCTTAAGCWQGNQAMHAFIPAADRGIATRILDLLASLDVERRLAAHRMEGTCNWAQPGRIARLLGCASPTAEAAPRGRSVGRSVEGAPAGGAGRTTTFHEPA